MADPQPHFDSITQETYVPGESVYRAYDDDGARLHELADKWEGEYIGHSLSHGHARVRWAWRSSRAINAVPYDLIRPTYR